MTSEWQVVEDASRRALRYWYVDGLTEIAIGLVLGLVALLFWIEEVAPGTPLAQATAFTIPILVIASAFLVRWLIGNAKKRLTYRRTGYVSYHRPPRWRYWLGAVFGAFVGASVAALLTLAPGSVRWLPAIQGIAVALALALTGHRYNVQRFYLYAALALLTGFVAGNMPWSSERAAAVCFGGTGLTLAVGGVATLLLYLRRTSARAQ